MVACPLARYPMREQAIEIRELVELYRDDPELSPDKFSGMDYLASLLEYLQTKTDGELAAEVRAFCRTNPFFPFR